MHRTKGRTEAMTPTLEARLAEVLPCGDDRLCRPANVTMGGTPSPILHSYKCLARLRPAILALIRTLLREERERCAEVALRRVAPDSPDHVAADCTECHDGLMLVRDIRALGSNIED